MANRAATLKVWGDAVFDLPGFARAIYPPSCDSDNAGGSICSQGRSCSSTAGLMGAWGSQGLGHRTLELGDCSAMCLASAGVSPVGWQCLCLAGNGRMQDCCSGSYKSDVSKVWCRGNRADCLSLGWRSSSDGQSLQH